MNDFTKEELQYFLMTIKPFHWLWEDDPLVLEEKLQLMIDNYCEHSLKTGVRYKKDIYCTKCNQHFSFTMIQLDEK